MIFSSLVFVFGFLPLALLGYALMSRIGFRAGTLWLIFVSLVFYGFWAPYLIILISVSLLFNYALSVAIRASSSSAAKQMALLWLGIAANLAALIYYKYAFALLAWAETFGVHLGAGHLASVVLPLGISFFSFTQIGYLVDCKDGITKSNNFLDYLLFVTFFPHLIAGPIVHNGELMLQFADRANRGLQAKNLAPALTLFVMGMAKKSLFADPLSGKIALGFAQAGTIKLIPAWITALSYSFQLYFDFSGYSDMAVALALMFNVRFPANFNSPYKARSIIEFWQRWHMSLTRYLNQYLYNPIAMGARRARMARGLPMTRKEMNRPAVFLPLVVWPTMATMTLAGIWHGAGMQFLVFGALHGFYLSINHAWRTYGPKAPTEPRSRLRRAGIIAIQVGLTYLAVLIGQVFFRAASVSQAWELLRGMVGLHGLTGADPAPALGDSWLSHLLAVLGLRDDDIRRCAKIVGFFAITWFMPNTLQIMASVKTVTNVEVKPASFGLLWQPSLPWAIAASLLAFLCVMSLGGTTEFLYFQF